MASSAAARMASTSWGSLTARSLSTRPPAGTSSTPSPAFSPSLRAEPDAYVVVVEAGAAPQPAGHVARHVAPHLHRLVAVHLTGGLLDIAEVGQEEPFLGRDEAGAIAAREAGEVAHVEQVGHEQAVELALGEQLHQPVPARLHGVHGLHVHPCIPSFSISSASRYPSTPLPCTEPRQRSRITDTRRHSSRSSTADRWTSTAGTAATSSASRIAHE